MSRTAVDPETLALLADVAASFATPDVARARALRDAGGGVDRAMWRALGDNGWLSILLPESLDGAGLGVEAVAIVARRLGYAGFPEPFVAAGVLAPLALTAAPERLAPVIGGERMVGVAWQPVAARDGVLDGESRFVHVGDADAYVVAGDDGALHWVEAADLDVVAERCADGTLSARLTLSGVRAEGFAGDLDGALDVARVAVSAELVGVMDRALELTLEHLRSRQQFGRPIGAFQALQHRAADMWIQRELTVAALEAAIAVLDDDASTPDQRAAAASSVKARAASAAPRVCGEALQLHGAIGFTDEYDLGAYINRALTLAPWLGGAAEHRRRYASLVPVR